MRAAETLVVGGGVMGLAVAWGLARAGERVRLVDAATGAPRASTANFGLVWLQSKGENFPAYARWTRAATDAWPDFATELTRCSGIDPRYRRTGGLAYCLGESEWQARAGKLARMRAPHPIDPYGSEMLERGELERLMPGVGFGREVTGASWNPHDGEVDPLRLVRALRLAAERAGVVFAAPAPVTALLPRAQGFEAHTGAGQTLTAERVVLAAGLGNPPLARAVGIDPAVHADRGQILVTERVPWRLPLPANGLRQSVDGTVLVGATKEGPDAQLQMTDPWRAAGIAARAVRTVPALARARVVRAWAGLRTLSDDSAPVYARSARWPGAIAVNCHSGITLAPLHATRIAAWVRGDAHDEQITPFSPRRFDVPTPA